MLNDVPRYDVDDGKSPQRCNWGWYLRPSTRFYCHHTRRLVRLSISSPFVRKIHDDGNRYHTRAPSVAPRPIANSTLINGKGRYFGGPLSPLSIIDVVPGVRYRFRLVAISCDPNYVFSIDGHKMVSCIPSSSPQIPTSWPPNRPSSKQTASASNPSKSTRSRSSPGSATHSSSTRLSRSTTTGSGRTLTSDGQASTEDLTSLSCGT